MRHAAFNDERQADRPLSSTTRASRRASTRRCVTSALTTWTYTSVSRSTATLQVKLELTWPRLVHWPVALNPNGSDAVMPRKEDGSRDLINPPSIEDTWKGMEKLLSTGKVRAIGVCNVSPSWMDKILKVASVVPAVNQSERPHCGAEAIELTPARQSSSTRTCPRTTSSRTASPRALSLRPTRHSVQRHRLSSRTRRSPSLLTSTTARSASCAFLSRSLATALSYPRASRPRASTKTSRSSTSRQRTSRPSAQSTSRA